MNAYRNQCLYTVNITIEDNFLITVEEGIGNNNLYISGECVFNPFTVDIILTYIFYNKKWA